MFWYNKIRDRDIPAMGASGAVFATTAFLACVAPKMTFQIYGIIPVPAWLFVSGVFVWDAVSAINDRRGGTDNAGIYTITLVCIFVYSSRIIIGHVAGTLAGIAYFLLKRFGL